MYILLYREVEILLPIKSLRAQNVIAGTHKNIWIIRHPAHNLFGINNLYWTHHDKYVIRMPASIDGANRVVVVDQRQAFLGGLDLCFGRYDTHEHKLSG